MKALGLEVEASWFQSRPSEQAEVLAGRVKLAAKLLGRAFGLGHSQALKLLAQALRFAHWHQLSAHLGRAEGLADGPAPESWLDGLAAAVALMPAVDDELALHPGHLQALERLAGTLAMLGDLPPQRVLDEVLARLFAGQRWADVMQRHPLKAARPLYGFEVHPEDESGLEPAGGFVTSLACRELIEELDEIWQGYDGFPPARQRQARRWVESALDAQPGFLEAGLALAWMQHDARDALASITAARYVKAAEALIAKGFKGTLPWAVIDNRFYHRLLWLQMSIASKAGHLTLATQAARKQLRLNPNDNLGVRQVLPCLQLRQGQVVGARRALAHLQGEIGLGASLVRSVRALRGRRAGAVPQGASAGLVHSAGTAHIAGRRPGQRPGRRRRWLPAGACRSGDAGGVCGAGVSGGDGPAGGNAEVPGRPGGDRCRAAAASVLAGVPGRRRP